MAPAPMFFVFLNPRPVPKRLSPARWDQSHRRIYRVNLHVAKGQVQAEIAGINIPLSTKTSEHKNNPCCTCIALKITKHIIYIYIRFNIICY